MFLAQLGFDIDIRMILPAWMLNLRQSIEHLMQCLLQQTKMNFWAKKPGGKGRKIWWKGETKNIEISRTFMNVLIILLCNSECYHPVN